MQKFWYLVCPITGKFWTENDTWSADRDDALEYTNYVEALDEADRMNVLLEAGIRARRAA